MKTHLKVEVNIWTEDITSNFTVEEMIKLYGKSEVLSAFSAGEIIEHHEPFLEMLLEAIGDDRVAEYYETYLKNKVNIA